MKPHLIQPAFIEPMRLIGAARQPNPFRKGFWGVPMDTLARTGGTRHTEHKVITNVTNHLRVVNHILFHMRIHTEKPSLVPFQQQKQGVRFVQNTVDQLLREQLDRELLLMERGENIAANQRRRAVLRRALEQKPARIIRHFYGVQMRILAGESPSVQQDGFQPDIIREEHTRTTQTVYEHHYQQTAPVQQQLPQGRITAPDIRRVADQVIRQLDQRMKLQRDRNGIW